MVAGKPSAVAEEDEDAIWGGRSQRSGLCVMVVEREKAEMCQEDRPTKNSSPILAGVRFPNGFHQY